MALTVCKADWHRDQSALRSIRTQVFVQEQGVHVDEEWDGEDEGCEHVLVYDDAQAVATGRLTPDGHIGRMAVLRSHRGRGAGSAALQALVDLARARGLAQVVLSAQVHAIPFYARHGFEAHGPEYEEARMPHRSMSRRL
jgi:predicted GNAT family N-acyltransferase